MLDWDAEADGAEAKAEKDEKALGVGAEGAEGAGTVPLALLFWVMDDSNAGPGMSIDTYV